MVRITLSALLFSLSISLLAQYTYDFNDNCRNAYASIISLKFEEGENYIHQEKIKNPQNNIPYLLENYIYFLTVFIGEEESTFKSLDKKKDLIIDRLKDGDEDSPYYRYCLAQVNLQWAVVRTKFKEYVTATIEINKAYRPLEKNKEEYPDFLPNNINLGLLHTMIGTIPDNYNWAKKMVGIDGTIDQGVSEILEVLNASFTKKEFQHHKTECVFYLSFIQMNLMSNKDKTFDYLKMIEDDKTSLTSPLAIYALSKIYMGNGMNDKAIDLLLSRPLGKEYYPFYYLDYVTGLAKLRRLDEDADKYFYKYVINFKGINYIKDSYQKIAWHNFVQGNNDLYYANMQKTEKYGSTIVDADKQAEMEAEIGVLPNYHLLRGRLLFDGGYYEEAIIELTIKPEKKFLTNTKDTLEYTYRLGRIYHEWGKPDEAIKPYKETIRLGAKSEFYFAANAALKLGNIYESKGDLKNAEFYYQAAQHMENEEYQNSINQKAKAGLNRIEGK